jgi:uncharacterized protein YqgC (DUF456 family)
LNQVLLYALAGAMILIGWLGTFLPVLPGLPVMFAGMWLAAWSNGYARVGGAMLLVLGALTVLSVLLDFWATAYGARRSGGGKRAAIGASLGLLVGLFFGLPGLLLGPFAGALIGELSIGRHWRDATITGASTWVGLVLSSALKFALATAMLVVFAIDWLWN